MLGRIKVKRGVKRLSNWAALAAHSLSEKVRQPAASIFYYHRVADLNIRDSRIDDHNVTPAAFEAQIAALSDIADIVPLSSLTRALQSRDGSAKPLVSLTFDDGYGHFVSDVLPILKHYNAPATLSVVTGIVDWHGPMPFDKWAVNNVVKVSPETWKPISWDEIETCLASGLVAIGAHSHQHLNAARCTDAQTDDEVGRCAEILHARVGRSNVSVYAYPYGNSFLGHVPDRYVNAVRNAGFELALTTDFGKVSSESDPYRLPRIEAHGLDTPAVMRAKVEARVSPFYLHDRCRAAVYGLANARNTLAKLKAAG